MDFIREWKWKTLDSEQVFGGVLNASQRRFHSHVFFRPTVLSEAALFTFAPRAKQSMITLLSNILSLGKH